MDPLIGFLFKGRLLKYSTRVNSAAKGNPLPYFKVVLLVKSFIVQVTVVAGEGQNIRDKSYEEFF